MGFNPAVVCWESGSNSGKNSGVSLLKLVGGPILSDLDVVRCSKGNLIRRMASSKLFSFIFGESGKINSFESAADILITSDIDRLA